MRLPHLLLCTILSCTLALGCLDEGDDDSAGDDDASGDDDTAGDDDDGTGDGWLSEPDEIGTCRCSATPTRPGPGAPLAAAAVLVALRRRGRGDQSTGSRSARQVA